MTELDRVAATAGWTAAERARKSARQDRLFEDPLAAVLAGEEGRALSERMREDGADSGFAIRTRFVDDALTDAMIVRGAAFQVVLLAAGMDARPYRLDLPRELTWYELDRRALLELKGSLLADLGATPRCERRPVGADLTVDWTGVLVTAGFDPARPTVWVIEGLIFYLDFAAVHRLLDEITALSAPPPSELIMDTIGRSVLESPYLRARRERLAEYGAPWLFGTDQPEADLLDPRGWSGSVHLYSEVGALYGRWPHPVVPREPPRSRRTIWSTPRAESSRGGPAVVGLDQ